MHRFPKYLSFAAAWLALGGQVSVGQVRHFGVEFVPIGGAQVGVINDNVVIENLATGDDGVRVRFDGVTTSARFQYEPIPINENAELNYRFFADDVPIDGYRLQRSPDQESVTIWALNPKDDLPAGERLLSRELHAYRDGTLVHTSELNSGREWIPIAVALLGIGAAVLTSTKTTVTTTLENGDTVSTTTVGPDWAHAVPVDTDGDGLEDFEADEVYVVSTWSGELQAVNRVDMTGSNVQSVVVDWLGDDDFCNLVPGPVNPFPCWEDDIDRLTQEIAAGSMNPRFDVNGDGNVDIGDVSDPEWGWLRQAGDQNLGRGRSYLLGDANLDGVVDVADFNIWNAHKFETGSGWSSGDWNADGFVDVADFNIWNANKFNASSPQSVPEPDLGGGMVWLLLMGMGLITRKRTNDDWGRSSLRTV